MFSWPTHPTRPNCYGVLTSAGMLVVALTLIAVLLRSGSETPLRGSVDPPAIEATEAFSDTLANPPSNAPALEASPQPPLMTSPDTLFRAWLDEQRCTHQRTISASQRSEHPTIAQAQTLALARLRDGCASAASALDRLGIEDPNQAPLLALREGSPVAEAHSLLTLGMRHGFDYADALARQHLMTSDPDLLMAVADYLSARPAGYHPVGTGLDLHLIDAEKRRDLLELSSQLLGCRLGADCSPDGWLASEYCVYLGACYRSVFEIISEDLLSPTDFRRVLALEAAMALGIRSGDLSVFDL